MTAIEHRELKGITVKNMLVTIISTASIVLSVAGAYYGLKSDMGDLKNKQETTDRVNEIRLKLLEGEVSLQGQEIHELMNKQKN